MMKRLIPILFVLFVLCALAACSENPVAPPATLPVLPLPTDTLGPMTSVPLSIGDSWTYERTWKLEVLTAQRGRFYPPRTGWADVVKEIVATEKVLGKTYPVERQCQFVEGAPDSVVSYRRLRQDETGLYRLIADLSAPPGALDGIESIEEFTRLEFPLDVGTGWPLLGGLRSSVVAKETVKTVEGEVEAYRISVTSHRDGENDFILVWYNQDGLIRRHNHSEVNAIDIESGFEVIVVTDEVQVMRKGPVRQAE
jgi:hypothetical protein